MAAPIIYCGTSLVTLAELFAGVSQIENSQKRSAFLGWIETEVITAGAWCIADLPPLL
jgi:hypothetical protein